QDTPSNVMPVPDPVGEHKHHQGRAVLLMEGFEDITTVPWTVVNRSSLLGTTSVFQGNTAVFVAHAGPSNSYAGMNFNSAAGTSTISTWLLSPQIMTGGASTLTFYTRTVSTPVFPDRLQVRQ